MPHNAFFYANENTDSALVPSKDGFFYANENTDSALVLSKDGRYYATENTGFILPTRITVGIPQIGWGAPMTPGKDVVVISENANGYAYTTEGDVT